METRFTPLLIAALVIVLGGYFFFFGVPGAQEMKKYQSSVQGIRFSYPANYELSQERERDAARPWHVIVLAQKDTLPPPQDGEGPPVIAIIIFDNVEGQTLEEWVRTSTFSNFKLSASGELASTSVSGTDAIAYHYTGLYETEAIAAVHGDKIYFFSVGWLDAGDQIRKDFDKLLRSVEFI